MRRLIPRRSLGSPPCAPASAAWFSSAAAVARGRSSTVLSDRTLIHVHGDEAGKFLQGLVTNDVARLSEGPGGQGMFCHLLNAKGRTMFEAFVATPRPGALPELVPGGGGDDGVSPPSSFLLDCHVDVAKRLTRHLKMHKLRAKVKLKSLADTHEVRWSSGGDGGEGDGKSIDGGNDELCTFPDPRAPITLGCRSYGKTQRSSPRSSISSRRNAPEVQKLG